jgi:toxin FitB
MKPRPDHAVGTWMEQIDVSSLWLSSLTLGEIQKGISKLKLSDGIRAAKYSDFFQEKIIVRYQDRILPMDLEVALRWGEIMGLLEANGIRLPIADGLIAATASVHGLVLVTRNEKDFRRAGIEIYNPWKK